MMGRRIAVAGTLLIALLGVPRPSEAGLLEIIWEMSGPRMLGISVGCMVNVESRSLDQCRLGSLPTYTVTKMDTGSQPTKTQHGPFLVLAGTLMGSTGHDSDTQGYDWGEIWMAAFEPGVAVRSYENANIQVHHGTGISYEWLFGRDIRHFDKFAFTVTPIDVAYKRVAVGFKLRLYPNGFTDDEFKGGPLITKNRAFETTFGFTFSIIFKKKPCDPVVPCPTK